MTPVPCNDKMTPGRQCENGHYGHSTHTLFFSISSLFFSTPRDKFFPDSARTLTKFIGLPLLFGGQMPNSRRSRTPIRQNPAPTPTPRAKHTWLATHPSHRQSRSTD